MKTPEQNIEEVYGQLLAVSTVISARKGEPGYREDTPDFDIYLDGEPVKYALSACQTVNPKDSYVELYMIDVEGLIMLNGKGDPRIQRRYGKVEIRTQFK